MASFVTNQYRGKLASLDGESLTVALMDPSYVGGADDTDLSSVSGEVDVLDAPGYLRQAVTGVWDPVDGVLRWDDPPSFDAAGADEIQTILIADTNGDIVAGLVWSTPVAGVDDMIPDVEHVAAVADEAGVVARIEALENDPGGPVEISGLLSTGEPAGLIPVTDGSGAVTLEPAPAGGGGGVSAPPIDLTSESSSPVVADLSGLTPDASSVLVLVPSGVDVEIVPPPAASGGQVSVGVAPQGGDPFDVIVDVGAPVAVVSGAVGFAAVELAVFDVGQVLTWRPVGGWSP